MAQEYYSFMSNCFFETLVIQVTLMFILRFSSDGRKGHNPRLLCAQGKVKGNFTSGTDQGDSGSSLVIIENGRFCKIAFSKFEIMSMLSCSDTQLLRQAFLAIQKKVRFGRTF